MHILDDQNPTSRDSSPVYLGFVPQPDRSHHSRQPCMSWTLLVKSSQVKSSQVKFIAQQYTFIVWQTHITLRYKNSTDIYT